MENLTQNYPAKYTKSEGRPDENEREGVETDMMGEPISSSLFSFFKDTARCRGSLAGSLLLAMIPRIFPPAVVLRSSLVGVPFGNDK